MCSTKETVTPTILLQKKKTQPMWEMQVLFCNSKEALKEIEQLILWWTIPLQTFNSMQLFNVTWYLLQLMKSQKHRL